MFQTYAELFSGIGGWGEGAKSLALQPIFAVESDRRVANWYLRNNPSTQMFPYPIQDLPLNRLPSTDVDILYASPPCQSYSTARQKLTQRDDTAIGLEILRFADHLCPKLILIENVRHYLNFSTAKALIRGLTLQGYYVTYGLVDAWSCGVPQDRIRCLIAASREYPITLPNPTHYKPGWLEPLTDQDYEPSNWMHSIARHVPTTNPTKLFDWLAQNYHKEAHKLSGRWQYTMPLDRDEYTAFLLPTGNTTREITWRADFHPATTVTARCGGHHYRVIDRRYPEIMQLTMRGIAKLQTFTDTYQFPQVRAIAGHLIGNAVPPMLSAILTRDLMEQEYTNLS